LRRMDKRESFGLGEQAMKKQRTNSLKEYRKSSNSKPEILFEHRVVIAENAVADFGQFLLSIVGSIPPLEAIGAAELADAANAAIYLARKEYAFALLSLISVAPVIGDSIGKSGMVIGWLTRLAQQEGKIASLVKTLIKKGPEVQKVLVRAKDFIKANESQIKTAIQIASSKSSAAQKSGQKTNRKLKETVELESLPAPLRAVVEYISRSPKLRSYFANPEIVAGLQAAVDEIVQIFEQALETIRNISNPDAATVSAAEEVVSESRQVLKLRDLMKNCTHLNECGCQAQQGVMHKPEEREGYMHGYTLKKIADKAAQLEELSREGDDVEEWVEAKINSAGDLIDTVYDYVMYSLNGRDEQLKKFSNDDDF